MYNTTNVRKSSPALEGADATSEKSAVHHSSAINHFFRNKEDISDCSSTAHSVVRLRNCCTTILCVLATISFSFVIILWIVALIVDGQREMRGCVILWPIVAGVLFIAVLLILLRCTEHCCILMKRKRNLKVSKDPLAGEDSLKMHGHCNADIPKVEYVVYKQHTCIMMTYWFLTLALFCIMVTSVVQFFSLSSECFHHLQHNVNELLLGFEVLAYVSVVFLSILGCIFTCLLFGIVVHCCKTERIEDREASKLKVALNV